MISPNIFAIVIGNDFDINFLQCVGHRNISRGVAPARDCGHLAAVVRVHIWVEGDHAGGEADRCHCSGEGEGGDQGQDGEVKLLLLEVKVGVGGDGRDGASVRHGVPDVVLPDQHLHITGVGLVLGAVGGCQHVPAADDAATAPGSQTTCVNQANLGTVVTTETTYPNRTLSPAMDTHAPQSQLLP